MPNDLDAWGHVSDIRHVIPTLDNPRDYLWCSYMVLTCQSPDYHMMFSQVPISPLQWHHKGRDSVSNHQPQDCLPNSLFGCRSKKTWKLNITGFCAWNSLGTGEFPAQRASYVENVSIWWHYHADVCQWYYFDELEFIFFLNDHWIAVFPFCNIVSS